VITLRWRTVRHRLALPKNTCLWAADRSEFPPFVSGVGKVAAIGILGNGQPSLP
jgi:hypothetical protein